MNTLQLKNDAQYDVVGIGSPLIDFILEVEDDILHELKLKKGDMHLIDEAISKKIQERIKDYPIDRIPGGSAANVLAGIAHLGGSGAFVGKIGTDEHGDFYKTESERFGVTTFLRSADTALTGHAITFITSDSERTFATHLGAAVSLQKMDIEEDIINQAKILHVEGYLLDVAVPNLKEAALAAMEYAKKHGVRISIDVADPALVARNKDELHRIAREYADILFLNEDEARAFIATATTEKEIAREVAEYCSIAVVKLGHRGSIVSCSDEMCEVAPFEARLVNTNGAGDMYAGGFLYSLVQGYSLAEAGKIASYAASRVVEQQGARLDEKLDVTQLVAK
jgi:sugar/nucleoside kinase (ribokinase family)